MRKWFMSELASLEPIHIHCLKPEVHMNDCLHTTEADIHL